MGDVSGVLKGQAHSNEIFYGNISDPDQIHKVYDNTDVLLVTSSEEGFPMVVMEAMARGCIILATPVGDLPVHIKQGINGFLFSQVGDEQKIISEAVEILNKLHADTGLRVNISSANIKYAREHFGLVSFEKHYQKLFDKYLS
jgi:glycosyltransferase involved in cell wall biosynthesis